MTTFLNTTTHSVAWLHKRYLADELHIKVPFQRNPVWTVKQKSYLIDTILRGYPIPELYMQEYTDAEGNDVYVIVDGQQRLRSIIDFIAGKVALNGDDSPEWADMKFDDLSESLKKVFYNYNFVVRILPEMPEVQLRQMFLRLNRNVVALNPQELRHATYWGQFISCVEKLADDTRWSDIGLFTPNDVRRMLDVEFVSEIVVGNLHGVQNKKDTLDRWYEAYEEEFEEQQSVEAIFNAVIGEINGFFPNISDTRWRKKSDFYSLFIVMANHIEFLPLSRDQRISLRGALIAFANDVDRFLRDPDENHDVDKSVKKYAAAVERAASDLANRRSRQEELQKLVASHLVDPVLADTQ